MSIAISNFLLDFKQRGMLHEFNEVNSQLTNNCQLKESIFQQFSQSNIIKNEFLKSVILSQLSKTFQPSVFPDDSQSTPKTPAQNSIFSSIISEIPQKNPSNSSKSTKKSLNGQTNPMQSSEVFKIIYQQSFEKYSKIILTTSNKADKAKSFRAQIKNIVEGIIVSNEKKSGLTVDFSADKVTDSIIYDLENHEIVCIGVNNVKYNEEIIEQFFGSNKTKLFIPGFCIENEYKEENMKVSEERKVVEDNWEDKFFEYCIKDERLFEAGTVGELRYYIHLNLVRYLNSINFVGSCGKEIQAVDTVLKEVISKYFITVDKEIDEVLSDVHQHFSITLTRI